MSNIDRIVSKWWRCNAPSLCCQLDVLLNGILSVTTKRKGFSARIAFYTRTLCGTKFYGVVSIIERYSLS